MSTIVTRIGKGSALTWVEGDANVTNLNTDKADKASPTFTGTVALPATWSIAGTTVTPTATELNYVDGVTSAIQTQMDLKAALASPALTGTPTAPTAAVGTLTTQLATTAFVAAGPAYIYIRDEKSVNTAGGGASATTWHTRTLQTEVSDTGSFATLGSNQITLTAGTYYCRARAPAALVAQHKLRLRNVTTGPTTVLVGATAYNAAAASVQSDATLCGRFTIAASQALELQHYCTAAQATNGLGVQTNATEVEIYAEIEFWRIS